MSISIRNEQLTKEVTSKFNEIEAIKQLIINEKFGKAARFIMAGLDSDLIPRIEGSIKLGIVKIAARNLKYMENKIKLLDFKSNYAVVIITGDDLIELIGKIKLCVYCLWWLWLPC